MYARRRMKAAQMTNGKDNEMACSSYLMRSQREVGSMCHMEGSSCVCKCRVGDMHDVAEDTYCVA